MAERNEENRYRLTIDQVRKFLPHRQPLLLVDRVLEIHPKGSLDSLTDDKLGTRVVAIKNISYGEPVFQGHFPEFSIFPGVMIVEAMAQVSSFSLYPFLENSRGGRDFQTILVGVDQARFRRPVIPGDTLRIETEVVKCRGKLWVFQCQATVDGQKAAEAQIMANLILTGDAA